ncbi:MAG: DUF192 domain-containing protein [Rubrivivax sp.]|jgi:hypothetical protein|nr:DUF192 domain-containing protein [Rubrivivax sp.]
MTSIKRLAVLALVGFVGLVSLGAQAQSGPQPKLPTTPLTIGIHVVQAELAVTPEQQATGMMFRTRMGTNEGMLFVNDDAGVRCFWMRNTLVPLTIAFIADDGTIVNTADMEPRSEKSHCSAQPVRFALEMNLGWFAKRGIKPGAKISGKPFRR